jgi:outer membrane protein assembly factor BamB
MNKNKISLFLVIVLSTSASVHIRAADSPQQILLASGVRGGLIVHLGCGDGSVTAALCAGESYLVQGLDADLGNVERARASIRDQGLYGRVSVNRFDGRHLPYVDNLVNAIVASDLGGVPIDEVMRVLAPRGVALIGGKQIVKPWPDEIDEWSHYLHAADNNALAEDRRVGPPRHMQWLAGPTWTRHHHADKGTDPTIRAVVSTRGRLYYMVDETKSSNREVPSNWFLVARDAFSGVLLWKKPLQVDGAQRRLELVWRTLIADGPLVYAPLGPARPLSAIDAASGKAVREYAGTEGLEEVVKDRGILLTISSDRGILALRADTGEQLWQWAPEQEDTIVPVTLAAANGRAFVKTDNGVTCLDSEGGRILWQVPLDGPEKNVRLRYPRERLIVVDGVVLCTHGGKDPKDLDRDKFEFLGSHPRVRDYGGKLAALSAEDGTRLWQSDYLPGLESMPGEIYVSDGQVWLGPDFAQPRDLRTGQVRMNRPVLDRLWTTGHHYRCYPGKATCNYILTAKRGIELIDLSGASHSRNNWVRATCRVGVTPCNGLLYAPPHSCGCYMEAKLYGFWALAAAGTVEEPKVEELKSGEEGRLVLGAAFGTVKLGPAPSQPGDGLDWPTFRSDAGRSGCTNTRVSTDSDIAWTADVGGRLSQPVCADGRVVVTQIDAHTVHCLDAANGDAIWSYTAGGRVDSPPTLYRGLVLFGSRDGWVYCLRAADGALVWRRLAAPQEMNAVAYEQLESLWPIHGSLLVHNDTVYASAGRSSYLDGGIVLCGLNPETGEVRCTAQLTSEHAGVIDPPAPEQQTAMDEKISQNNTDYKTFLAADQSDAFSMRGALTDVMTADGESIYMRHMRFSGQLEREETTLPHLFSTSSLLDGSEHHRSYWVLGTGNFSRTPVAYPWIVSKSLAVPYGLMLVYDANNVWCVRRDEAKGRSQTYTLLGMPRPNASDDGYLFPDFAVRSKKRAPAEGLWAIALSLRPRSMIRTGDTLIIGGEAAVQSSEQTDSGTDSEDQKRGTLSFASDSDGRSLTTVPLSSPPVWDGMAAADGKLFVATTAGTIVCLGGS